MLSWRFFFLMWLIRLMVYPFFFSPSLSHTHTCTLCYVTPPPVSLYIISRLSTHLPYILPFFCRLAYLICHQSDSAAPSRRFGCEHRSSRCVRCSSELKLKDDQSAEVLGSLYFFLTSLFNRSGVKETSLTAKLVPLSLPLAFFLSHFLWLQ